MIKFLLKRILEKAPYDIVLSGNDFMFQTDLGIRYTVSFNKEDIVLGGCDTTSSSSAKWKKPKAGMTPR